MKKDTRATILSLAFAGLALAGCSSAAPTKPSVASPATTGSRPESSRDKSAQPERGQTSTSSLDAYREGKAPTSGPLVEVYFSFDSYDLRPETRKTLQAHAAWLKANPSVRVEIEGHCDERGTTEYNLALGAKRARAAREYLLSLGVAPARISATSYGEELLVCKEKSEECYQKNRRDRFVIVATRPAS